MSSEEEWKPIKDFEGLYQVSNMGHVERILKNGSLKPVKRKYAKYRLDRPFHSL